MNLQFLRPKESENVDVAVAVKISTEKSADPISERKIVSVPTQCPLLHKPYLKIIFKNIASVLYTAVFIKIENVAKQQHLMKGKGFFFPVCI